MAFTYAWAKGSHSKLNPQVVGEELERIRSESGGALIAGTVVDQARPDDSPLHDHFEWDDSEAARKHREQQARNMIRGIRVVFADDDGQETPRRLYLNVKLEDGPRAYLTVDQIAGDEHLKIQALRRALAELDSFQQKYRELAPYLQPVFSAMQAVRQRSAAA